MRIGAVLPTYELSADPVALWDFAQAVEHMGYSHLTAIEHILGADLANRPNWEGRNLMCNFHEPFVLFGYLSGLVPRLEFATNVMVLPQRQTALFAKQAAEVDVLSHGRLRLGVGVGWVEPEFQALNEDYHTRGIRIDEQISVLRRLWTQESVTFHGRWHHIEEMGIQPLPIQRPIPIWLGGHVEATLRRVAMIGDGWMPLLNPDEEARKAIAQIHAFARAAGRDPTSIGIEGVVFIEGKTPEKWQQEAFGWKSLGATHLTVYTMDAGLASPKAHIEALGRFKEIAAIVESA